MNGPQGPQSALSTLISDAPTSSVQRAFRSRSDSLDIFTMSPLGTPPFDASHFTLDAPSAPQLRLPEPPILDLDLGLAKVHEQPVDLLHRSPPSTPNSAASFSFSPPRHIVYRHEYGNSPYPPETQSGFIGVGTSYDTDMTSLLGSWEDKELFTKGVSPVTWEDKGKGVQRGVHSGLPSSVLQPSSSKGKDKVTDAFLDLTSPSRTTFEANVGVQVPQDADYSIRTTNEVADRAVSPDEASLSPVVRLSSSSQYRDVGQYIEAYAGPSTRNGDINNLTIEDPDSIPASPDVASIQDVRTSSASSSRPISPLRLSTITPFRSMNEVSDHTHLPTHRRSFSSLSLRSIRSSSSRSLASIRSTFSGSSLSGKVRSMTPATKKIKGGLRKIFKRNTAAISVDATQSTSTQQDNNDNEADHPEPARPAERMTTPEPEAHQLASDSRIPEPGHTLESSSDSQVTVMHLPVSTAECVPGSLAVEGMVDVPRPRSMSEPTPLTSHVDELQAGVEEDDTQDLCTQVVEELQVCSEAMVTVKPNHFNDTLPRELQLDVLRSLLNIHQEEYERAERGESHGHIWSVRTAGKSKWVGRDKGLRELVKFSRVSKSWQSLVFDGQLWDILHLTSSPTHLSLALLLRLADHAGSFVRSLDLRGWTHLDSVTLRSLVRSLSLTTPTTVFPGVLQANESMTIPAFPLTNLTHVSLRTCSSVTAHALHHMLLRAPSLRSVDLRGLDAVTNTTCSVLAAFCPNLEAVDLGRCPNMDGEGVRGLVGDGTAARSQMEENGVPKSDVRTRRTERSCSSLKVLKMSGLKRLNEEILATLGRRAPNLEVLDLSGSGDLTDEAIESFIAWDEVWDKPSEDGFDRRKIELNAREMGRDPTVESGRFFKRVTHLRHLNLSSCVLLTDAACTHLAHCVPELEFLELAGIGQELKDDGIVRLLRTTPLLRRLDLEDASDITDAVIGVLTTSPPDNVCRRALGPQLPPGHNLEHLILSYALNITNDALLALMRSCQRLAILECDNTRISATTMKEFVKLVRQRRIRGAEVVAVDCRGITEALIKELAGSGHTRARMGFRHYDARSLGYVDARDEEDFGVGTALSGLNVDDCDDMRVTIKSFWSWQAVDAIQQAREKRRKMALSSRRHTDAGVLRDAFRRAGILDDVDDEDDDGGSGAGPSLRPRWLNQWARTSASSSPMGFAFSNDDDRGCILM